MNTSEGNRAGTRRFAPFLIILAACLWGTMGLFVRRLNQMGLSAMEIVELRSILAALILLPGTALKDRKALRIRPKNLLPLAGSGVLSIVFFNYCYFSTIATMNLSAAAILLYTSPIFVMLMSLVFFREKLTVKKLLALVLAFAGCCLVSGLATAAEALTVTGVLLGLGSGIGYALYSIFSRVALNQGVGSITITVYTFLFAAVGGAFFTDFDVIRMSLAAWGWGLVGFLILYCMVTTVLPYLLYTTGLSYVENGPASIMACVEPVVATLLGLLVFSEKPTVSAQMGMLLVLAALVLLSLGDRNAEK